MNALRSFAHFSLVFIFISSPLLAGPVIRNNPAEFVSPNDPAYFEAQDLSVDSVRKLKREKTDRILKEAGNPRGELEMAKALCNWVGNTLRHPYFNPHYKTRFTIQFTTHSITIPSPPLPTLKDSSLWTPQPGLRRSARIKTMS